jgi:hypothetical protein
MVPWNLRKQARPGENQLAWKTAPASAQANGCNTDAQAPGRERHDDTFGAR